MSGSDLHERVVELELLYELAVAVGRAETCADIYHLAIAAIARAADADRVAVLVARDGDGDGALELVASRGLSPAYRERARVAGVSAHAPRIVAAGELAACDRDEGIAAIAYVPIAHQRTLLGALAVYRDADRPFSPCELRIATAIGAHIASAITRHRSQEAIAHALRQERASTRACEEILSLVSHDLRSPLGTILMGASAIETLAQPADDPAAAAQKLERVRGNAQRMHRQAKRMARHIDDLVDFASIQSGRIALARADHAPAALIAAASELFSPLAAERGVRFEAVQPALPPIRCDAERGVQVLSNLIENALKVTPRGGTVAVGAEHRDATIFYVRDTGPGIADGDLPHLFERYWRSSSPSYKGTGLGLSIASSIVAAHGGRIWADSAVGAGSTFFFSLDSR